MIRTPILYVLGFAIALLAQNQPTAAPTGPVLERYVPNPDSVGFDADQLQSSNGSVEWIAMYSSGGKVAKFRIEFGPAKRLGGADVDLAWGEGRFVSEAGSDATALLADLQKALEAKRIPRNVRRVTTLPFDFVILGTNQSRDADGGFSSNPSGNWTAMKIFLGENKSECEVFLNLNAAIRKGEFSIKDADYGNLLLAQLAKVL